MTCMKPEKFEVDHLVIRTEDPSITITLRANKAEIAFIDDPQSVGVANTIKNSLKPFKISTPFYRLRVFWTWIYLLFIMIAMFLDYKFHGFQKLPAPPVLTAGQTPPPPPPPMPPPFPGSVLIVLLVSLILLTGWFIHSYGKLDNESSTRIIRKGKRYKSTEIERPPSDPSQGI